jgi:hypothetical protein
MTTTQAEVIPPDEHRAAWWHWIKVNNGEVWPMRWENRTGHWLNGNSVVSPVRAAELKWVYIRPTEVSPSA